MQAAESDMLLSKSMDVGGENTMAERKGDREYRVGERFYTDGGRSAGN